MSKADSRTAAGESKRAIRRRALRQRQVGSLYHLSSAAAQPAVGDPSLRVGRLPSLEYGKLGDDRWEEQVCSGWYPRWGKPVGTLMLLLLTLPFALMLAIPQALINWAIFRDPRRILYRQERVGRRGEVFYIYKFRTMREAPGSDFQSWQRGDGMRVTAFGRLMRRTHLDELPQLLNIIRGEMHFIGPRPEMVEIEQWASEVVPGFARRLAVKPGITGHAQVTLGYTGMDAEAYRAKLAANDFYLQNLSLWFDIAILARTLLYMSPLPKSWWTKGGAPALDSGVQTVDAGVQTVAEAGPAGS